MRHDGDYAASGSPVVGMTSTPLLVDLTIVTCADSPGMSPRAVPLKLSVIGKVTGEAVAPAEPEGSRFACVGIAVTLPRIDPARVGTLMLAGSPGDTSTRFVSATSAWTTKRAHHDSRAGRGAIWPGRTFTAMITPAKGAETPVAATTTATAVLTQVLVRLAIEPATSCVRPLFPLVGRVKWVRGFRVSGLRAPDRVDILRAVAVILLWVFVECPELARVPRRVCRARSRGDIVTATAALWCRRQALRARLSAFEERAEGQQL